MMLNISWDQVPEPPSFEIRSRGMLIWGGNCLVSYKNVTNNTRIKKSHLMFYRCEGKTRPDIILQVMKCEPKIRWKTKRNKLNEVSFAKLNNVPKIIF